MSVYCTGTFIGQRVTDSSISSDIIGQHSLKFTLSFTPTKRYPSAFGAGFYDGDPTISSSSIIHGTYHAVTQEASLIEMMNGTAMYEYQCKLTVDKTVGTTYLYGTWKSLVNSNIFGKLVMISESDSINDCISGIWTGEAQPAEELADFFIPVNPIRWCATLFRTNNDTWQMFGSGYFNDSADIPNQPLLFFSLDGKGTLDDMKIIKKYATIEYNVEYRGKISKCETDAYVFTGNWSNAQAGSYGSFHAEQCQLNPMFTYRLDICLCAVCTNILNPGDNRWFCAPCHFATCPGCNLNDVAMAHPHKLVPHILPTQKKAHGSTSVELISNAFKVFGSSPFISFRSRETGQLVWLTYNDMSSKCYALAKYWKQFLSNINQNARPFIVLLADTSLAYIASLLAGLLCQAVVVPMNGALEVDVLKHVLSTTDPSIIIVGEQYFDKISSILVPKSSTLIMTISQKEEQFQPVTSVLKDSISLTIALELGAKIQNDILSNSPLSNDTISAILSTSGSTGYPKGAIFTEDLLIPKDSSTLISPFIRIDYQPFDPVLVLSLMSTMQYGSSRGLTNLKDMWDDIRDIRPTSLGLSPAIWTFLYKIYLRKLTGHSTDEQRENAAREMQQSLGGRVISGTSGGGSISASILFFIRNVLKIDVVDMYGCRECGNISRDGILYPGVDVKLIPVPDLELDGETEGEICIHSPRMISGYWGIDNHSSFIDIDGKRYYKTGDIGMLNQRELKLLDRSGTMIKNSLAEWISPVKIENILEQLPEISSAFVLGDSSYAYVLAVVCPSEIGKTLNKSEMLQLIRFYGAHYGLRGSEIPQCIYIERDIIWNATNGLMKEKKCRAVLLKHYTQIKIDLFHQENVQEHLTNLDLNIEFVSVLENVLNRPLKGHINGRNTFLEIGADSLAVARLCKVYHERDIPLNSSTVYNYQLDHLEEILLKKRVVYNEIIIDIDWKREYQLPDHIKRLIQKSSSSRKTNILVTGCTGFLGPLLISEIVSKTDRSVVIYCLIRANDIEHAQRRLEQDLQKCERFSSIDWTRIRCIVGDVSKENLGLTQNFYNELTQQIGLIYHNASIVNLQLPYKALKESNVFGTLNCLEFAVKSNARLVYTSSTASLPALIDFKEDSNGWITLTSNDMNLKDGYGQSKVVVEQLLYTASTLGVDIVVVRPCTISADTRTGFSNCYDFINLLLRAEVEMGCMVENADLQLHPIPVDYCSKAIVALAMHPDSGGRCFNFYGNGLSISCLHNALVQQLPGVIKRKIEQNNWKQYVMTNLSENSPAWRMREQIASMIFTSGNFQQQKLGVRIEMTKEFLEKKCGLNWFEVTEQDLIKSVEYMINVGFLSCQPS
ncbi:unnamed protein product [Rotaria sp. Silwood2]|nr:unnamed protein product [Rotaria sp. Silwood2]CAF3152963.1 unnamed protein product [Rotaria sp. Silwood2]CAF3918913.1 unnamed protein product [Rotaria sp. Silwood2]CAF4174514.1 unnamed protein product [Rotaria sp. Silwood2]CAF4295439.1 unnamed protein product [Rotaria sp. Silwood2]